MTSSRMSAAERRSARAAAAAPDADGAFTHRQILTVLGGLMLGMFLAALDQTVVSTAIRTIADDLRGYDLQAWATTAFLITSTISTPLYGKLSDMYGRRPFYLFAIGVFVVGSAFCGIATSMYELAVWRAVQGIGAGGLMSLALAIIGDLVPPRQRARYQSYFMAVFGTSSVLGPVVGGFLAGQGSLAGVDGWRWIFWINVPLGFLAFAVVSRVLHLPHRRREHRIDWPGALALVTFLVPLLVVAEQGRTWGWGSTSALACYGVGAAGLAAFLVAERLRGRRPAAAAPVRQPELRRGRRREHRDGRRHVRRAAAPAAVPADRPGLQPHGGRTADEPARRRHHGRRDGLGHRHRPHRLLQGLPAGRHGAHGGGAAGPVPGGRRRHVGVDAGALHGRPGPGPGPEHAAGDPRRPERGVAAGDGRGHLVGDVLPPDGRHDRHGGVPLGAVHPAAAGHRRGRGRRGARGPDARAAAAAGDRRRHARSLHTSFIQQLPAALARAFEVGFSDSLDVVFLIAAGVVTVGFVVLWSLPELPLRTQSGIQAAQAESAGLAGSDPSDTGEQATRAVGAAAPTSVAPPVGRPGDTAR